MTKKIPFQIDYKMDLGEIIFTLTKHLSENQLVKFVSYLDLAYEDWSLTEKLYNHFKKEMEKLNKENGDIKERIKSNMENT